MLLKLLLNFALLWQAQTLPSTKVPSAEDAAKAPAAQPTAWITDHEVWIQTDAGRRRITYDAMAAEPVAVSPHGDRVVYGSLNPNFTPDCGNTPRKYVVLVSASGQFLWKAALEEACNDFDRFEWIDEDRIGIMQCGHANCLYWILDANSGKTLKKMFGGFDFVWSHDQQTVARRKLGTVTVDDHTSYDDLCMVVFNDDEEIAYPPRNERATHLGRDHTIGYLAWSPDDAWVSFAEIEYPSYDSYVVLVSPSGKILRESLPVDVQYNTTVEWTDSSHFELKASGQLFRFKVADGELREIVQH